MWTKAKPTWRWLPWKPPAAWHITQRPVDVPLADSELLTALLKQHSVEMLTWCQRLKAVASTSVLQVQAHLPAPSLHQVDPLSSLLRLSFMLSKSPYSLYLKIPLAP